MEITIGVTYTPKEIKLELAEGSKSDDVKAAVAAAMSADEGVLWLEDKKGRQIGIPADKLAYVEIGSDDANRPIGFG